MRQGLGETLEESGWIENAGAAVSHADDSGLTALVRAAAALDIALDAGQLWHLNGVSDRFFSVGELLRSARQNGIKARTGRITAIGYARASFPLLVFDDVQQRWFTVLGAEAGRYRIAGLDGPDEALGAAEMLSRFGNRVIRLSRARAADGPSQFGGYGWFIAKVLKQSGQFQRVILASVLVNLVAIVTPMIFQVVIDQVLVSRGANSLTTLAIALAALALFDPVINYSRGATLSYASGAVSAELSSGLMSHLLRLPLSYFQDRKAGDTIARIREMEQIRSFMTGSAVLFIVDFLFIFVYIGVLLAYSPRLTLIVLGVLVIFATIWLVVAPILRRRVTDDYERQADNTAYITESVSGVATIKSLALTERFSKGWERVLGRSITAGMRANVLGLCAGLSLQVVQKISVGLILWFGVDLAMSGTISVGQLVAFNMIASQATMPILRLSQVWQDFQNTQVAVRRLADIAQAPTERVSHQGRASFPRIEGHVEFRSVSFRYKPDAPQALRRLKLTIAPGEVVGITGPSGSGKSTITKMIQGFYAAETGQVLVDGVDLAMADVVSLRRQIGVVPQESFLFNGSLRDNISLGNAAASEREIARVIELSGVDLFLDGLSHGLDTQVGERGGLLSGGQRQRVALARALLGDPRILILDEATSAVDYETEAAIAARMPEIFAGRTVLMIAHRLSSMPLTDRVAVLRHGSVVELDAHATLIAQQDGLYRSMWTAQTSM
ncbi:type I secretion system permease/ATPase [uncultured Roseobacter sp.]|uniref:type I secretion system permease/ATPase n=1 Tax=uncultured Roseobacter sp. TaxID=114847 RepID=UPI00262D82E6|nr:type I secretion system permease/ATPase [uncultured Roseobacter sp.]